MPKLPQERKKNNNSVLGITQRKNNLQLKITTSNCLITFILFLVFISCNNTGTLFSATGNLLILCGDRSATISCPERKEISISEVGYGRTWDELS